jgi:hypothetical protein
LINSSSEKSDTPHLVKAKKDSMSSKLIPTNPSDVMVIRDVTPNVITLSVPFNRFGKLKVGGRGTIGKVQSHSPSPVQPH